MLQGCKTLLPLRIVDVMGVVETVFACDLLESAQTG